MANTYTQIHIHFVFAVKFRKALISKEWKSTLHKYITGIVTNQGHKMLAINSMPDHVHLLIGLRPNQSIADLMEMVKSDSSRWINENRISIEYFNWQRGYSAFSISKSQVDKVIHYILTQEEHHRKKTFLEEYRELLDEFGIEFDDRYLFKDPE
jgi:REP element-mobilizing transposase RayT